MPRSILNVKCQTGMRKCARLGGVTKAAALAVISRLQAEQCYLVLLTYLSVFAKAAKAPKHPKHPNQAKSSAVIARLQAEHKYHGRRAAGRAQGLRPRAGCCRVTD